MSATIDRSGWKRVRLGEVLTYEQPYPYIVHKAEYVSNGTPVLTPGKTFILGYTTETDGICRASSDAPRILFDDFLTISRLVQFDFKVKSSAVKILLPASTSHNLRFIFYAMSRLQFEVTDHQRHWINQFSKLEIQVPTRQEQDRIADAIDSIDTHISALQSLIAKYEAIKKATVNLLLEPKSYWRIVPLGEICEVCSTRRVHESDWTDSGVPFYRARELVALNEGRSITPLHISEKLYNELIASSGTIRPGDLLVTGVGSIGVPYLVKGNDKFYFKDGNIIWFKNRGEIWPDYFLHAFRSDHIQKQIMEMACVGTVGSYTITNGKRTLIALPPLDEQKRIVEILDSLDGTISGLKSQLAKAQDIKRGMMAYFFG